MTDEKKKLSKEERKEQAWKEYWRKLKPLVYEIKRTLREIDAEDDE